MPFVKLDTGILDSTLWIEKDQRDVFITALLMAEPREFSEPVPQIEVDSMNLTGFQAPPGWYGFCGAAGSGIVRRSMTEIEAGMQALRALGEPDLESRSKDFDGRRLIRIDGGYVILNFMAYRDRDYGAADRMRRLRERRKQEKAAALPRTVTPLHRNVTQAEDRGQRTEAEAEAEVQVQPLREGGVVRSARPAGDEGRRVHPDGGELMAATHFFEELGQASDQATRLVVADTLKILASEAGTLQTAFDYVLAAAKVQKAEGAVINRFWFLDEKYKPAPTTAKKSRRTREREQKWDEFHQETTK